MPMLGLLISNSKMTKYNRGVLLKLEYRILLVGLLFACLGGDYINK
jgi:hypothetical protein